MITSLVRSKGITALNLHQFNLNLSDQMAPRPSHGASRAEMTGLEGPVLEQIRHHLGSALNSNTRHVSPRVNKGYYYYWWTRPF